MWQTGYRSLFNLMIPGVYDDRATTQGFVRQPFLPGHFNDILTQFSPKLRQIDTA
jgi:hypothetical protein